MPSGALEFAAPARSITQAMGNVRRAGVAAAAALLVLSAGSARGDGVAADSGQVAPPLLPGVGSHDPRVRVRIDVAPWRAIVKLQATSGSLYRSCTGTLVAPELVLTAAHCVYNPRTRRNFRPQSLHVLAGYDRGRYAGATVGRRIAVAPGFDVHRPAATRASDWALVTLDEPLGASNRTLPILKEQPKVGAGVMLGGYNRDHPLIPMADIACRIVGVVADGGGRRLLRHDCAGSSGVSGAPLLERRHGRWFVAGISVAAEMGAASGLAALPGAALQMMEHARRP